VDHALGRGHGLAGRAGRKDQVVEVPDQVASFVAKESDGLSHHRGEEPRGRREPEREHLEAVETACPLESQVGECLWGHVHVVVGTRDVQSASKGAALEEGAALPLQRLHAEGTLPQVAIDVPAVPNEATLQRAVEGDAQRENAQQLELELVVVELERARGRGRGGGGEGGRE
jgi:hypothetical protein